MIDAGQIREHMDVEGSDGKHVGRVDKIKGGDIELTKFDTASGLKHHLIPLSWVDMIDDDTVRLSLTKDAARAAWRTEH